MRDFLAQFVDIFAQLLIFAIFVRVIFSWIRVDKSGMLYRVIYEATEPVLGFVRRITPRLGMIDISPIIAFLAIDLLRAVIISLIV